MSKDIEQFFQDEFNVSRETMDHLHQYEALLCKWNPVINLVSKSTLNDIWRRHFLDSAQIFHLFPEQAGVWLDLGSGGGFPALVLAILAKDQSKDIRFILVESDTRKSVFLRTVIQELGLNAKVIAERIESLVDQQADILSARALAPLDKLLEYAEKHLKPEGIAVFPKGDKYRQETAEAKIKWRFDLTEIPSKTNPNGAILKIGGISRV